LKSEFQAHEAIALTAIVQSELQLWWNQETCRLQTSQRDESNQWSQITKIPLARTKKEQQINKALPFLPMGDGCFECKSVRDYLAARVTIHEARIGVKDGIVVQPTEKEQRRWIMRSRLCAKLNVQMQKKLATQMQAIEGRMQESQPKLRPRKRADKRPVEESRTSPPATPAKRIRRIIDDDDDDDDDEGQSSSAIVLPSKPDDAPADDAPAIQVEEDALVPDYDAIDNTENWNAIKGEVTYADLQEIILRTMHGVQGRVAEVLIHAKNAGTLERKHNLQSDILDTVLNPIYEESNVSKIYTSTFPSDKWNSLVMETPSLLLSATLHTAFPLMKDEKRAEIVKSLMQELWKDKKIEHTDKYLPYSFYENVHLQIYDRFATKSSLV
jgi:hypothetical protein